MWPMDVSSPTKNTKVWFYNNEYLESEQDFKYLGVIFNFTSSLTLHNQYVIRKAVWASGVILSNYKVEVNPKIALELFDTNGWVLPSVKALTEYS